MVSARALGWRGGSLRRPCAPRRGFLTLLTADGSGGGGGGGSGSDGWVSPRLSPRFGGGGEALRAVLIAAPLRSGAGAALRQRRGLLGPTALPPGLLWAQWRRQGGKHLPPRYPATRPSRRLAVGTYIAAAQRRLLSPVCSPSVLLSAQRPW